MKSLRIKFKKNSSSKNKEMKQKINQVFLKFVRLNCAWSNIVLVKRKYLTVVVKFSAAHMVT